MNKKKVRILLVDDQPANLLVLQSVLAELDEELVSVNSGEEALRAVLDDAFAVVLLDVQMPTMNGFETAALLRRHPRSQELPIIFLTAAATADFPVEAAYALGAVDYMTKPFNPVVLRAKVAVFIDLHRKTAAIALHHEERHQAALRARDERIRLILDSTRDYAFIGTDVERNITEWEGGATDILGWDAAAALGRPADMIFTPEDRVAGVPDAEAARARDSGRALDRRWHLRRDGSRFFADGVMVPLRDDAGKLRGYAKIFRDVTAEKLAAEQLASIEAERERLFGQLEAASLLTVGQRSALELAVSDAPLGDVLDVLANTAEEYAGGAGLAAILLADGERARLRHAAGPSLPQQFMDAFDALPPGAPSGPAALAAASGEIVTAADIGAGDSWPQFRALALAHGLQSCRAMPILAPSGSVLGVFCWYRRAPRASPGDEDEALALLANTASLVIGQRHEEQERMAAEDRAHNILESISEGFLAIDADWRISYANHAVERLTGSARGQLAGVPFWDVFAQVRGTAIEQGLRRSAAERSHIKFDSYYDPYGRWLEINSCPTPDGGLALYFRDETDRRLAEEGIRRLAAVAEQSPDFIGITTPDATGMFLNPAGRRLSGIAPDAPISDYSLVDFFAPESRPFVQDVVLPALTGEPARWEGELRFADLSSGLVAPVYFKGFAVRDDRGEIIGLATVTRDITEQKNAEDALRRVAADLSEADHRKSEFLATLAHELRNPLAPIRTGLDLLRMAPADAGATQRVVGMMDRQLSHLIHLVNDLLDVARITRGKIELKKQPVALKTLVSMALETSVALIEAGGHKLDVDLPAQPIMLDVDTTRIVQVLSNLLNNAAKYTPAGGRIVLSAWTDAEQAMVAVSDSGIGIPAEALGTVFEMFTQVRGNMDRAQGGLGIGLSLVRRLIELHGGSVAADSAGRGRGSTFTLRLPLGAGGDATDAGAGGADAAPTGGPGLRVLVVDDNADAAESLAALLTMLGHAPMVARDGPGGLAMVKQYRPDLVFLDIGLPGMSGHEVARAIRATPELAKVVLVALTGWGASGDLLQAEDAGFDRHLTKPVSLESLRDAVRAAGAAP
ncbi:MAG: response regulator [Pseudomonadota bacterium]